MRALAFPAEPCHVVPGVTSNGGSLAEALEGAHKYSIHGYSRDGTAVARLVGNAESAICAWARVGRLGLFCKRLPSNRRSLPASLPHPAFPARADPGLRNDAESHA